MKIINEELEIDEIYKGKVKPIATGGYIPFFKKFIGRIVHIVLPSEPKAYWLFKKEDIKVLEKELSNCKFAQPYAKLKEDIIRNALKEISKDEFKLEEIDVIINAFEKSPNKKVRDLIKRIRKSYSK